MSDTTRNEERPRADRDAATADLPERAATPESAQQVRGGSLSAYFSKVQGEKQGAFKGG